jgi:hypothetical protein
MIRNTHRPTLEPLEARTLLATCHVTRLGDIGAGADAGGGHWRGDLRFCITKANAEPGPDTIRFERSGTILLTGALPDLATDMDMIVPSGPVTVQRNAGGDYRIFTVAPNARVRISGLRMANGLPADQNGGAILNRGALTLINTHIASNRADTGGGVYNSGRLLIQDSTVASNTASIGAGVYNSSLATIANSSISGNGINLAPAGEFAFAAGGGVVNTGSMTILGSTIQSNHLSVSTTYADAVGSGIYSSGPLTIIGSIINSNTATASGHYASALGGGVRASGSLTVIDSAIVGNRASASADTPEGFGGGIYHTGSSLTITNSTIAHNISSSNATITHSTIAENSDGIRITGQLTLRNSIVANNTEGDVTGMITSSGYNLIRNLSGGSGYDPSDILGVDPMLGPLQGNGGPTPTMALLPGSPAIDAGDPNPSNPPEWDQRGPGFPRIVNGRLDIGAYEVQATGMPAPVAYLAVLSTADLEKDDYETRP